MPLRVPITSWPKGGLTWSTSFNDLRRPESLGEGADLQALQFRLDLRQQALFQRQTLIRDTDVVNHASLVDALAEQQGFQKLIDEGAFLFSLRESAASFSDLNDRTGQKRAFPNRCELLRSGLRKVDRLLLSSGRLVEVPVSGSDDRFAALLDTLLREGPLTRQESVMLTEALGRAREMEPTGLLQFGNIYRFLESTYHLSCKDDLIQWCRAAHVLVLPGQYGLPLSSVDDDLNPGILSLLLSNGIMETPTADRWVHLYPTVVLDGVQLSQLSFGQVVDYRRSEEARNYFEAVCRVHSLLGSPGFDSAYGDCLACLRLYLDQIAVNSRIVLQPVQEALARQRLDELTGVQEALKWAIPVVQVLNLSLRTLSFVPYRVISEPARRIRLLVNKVSDPRRINALGRAISGTSINPPPAKSDGQRTGYAVRTGRDTQS